MYWGLDASEERLKCTWSILTKQTFYISCLVLEAVSQIKDDQIFHLDNNFKGKPIRKMVRPEVRKKRRQLAEAAVKSRKEQKKLEKVVLRKKHKTDRNHVLAELKKVQLQPDQLDRMHSTSSMQTRGLKRFTSDDFQPGRQSFVSAFGQAEQCLDAAQLIKRKKRKTKLQTKTVETDSSSEDTDRVSTDTENEEESTRGHTPFSVSAVVPAIPDCTMPSNQEVAENDQLLDGDAPQVDNSVRLPVGDKNTTIEKEVIQRKSEPAVYVTVNRDPEVEKTRSGLPIINEEQKIMEDIRYNDIVIISGETGSGKTTQLPQFLYEAGYTLDGKSIAITEPRRVAAIGMSQRVAYEMNLMNGEVGYQIRFSGNVSQTTQIKFMTDGVLLKECQQDFLLSKYSVIIIDEAHERSVFSDILIGLLSRIVPLRAKRATPLKLIIMSATLRLNDFTDNSILFPKSPPIIKIDARQYGVTVLFAKRTPEDYIEAAYKKVLAIHNKMPRGGILVFVTSQKDVKITLSLLKGQKQLFCLGLYAMLPLDKQQLVFKEPPEHSRLCVVATNVAETSITIPNIKYVVDTGREKRKYYDLITGVSRFITAWTSKSSAEQRAGRAGRMGPGYCYRLYSSAVFTNDFSDFSEPQILQKPVEDIVLQMKSMNINNVVNFPFPTRPSNDTLRDAERRLVLLGALDDSRGNTAPRLTKLGIAMADLPVGARCGKMIVRAPKDLLANVICLVSTLTVREMFINGDQFKKLRKKWAGHGQYKRLGDFMVMLKAVIVAHSRSDDFCLKNGLRPQAMREIHKLRRQLSSHFEVRLGRLAKLSEAQCIILSQLLLASFCDRIAKRLPDCETVSESSSGAKKVIKVKNAYECMDSDAPVYIGNDSVVKGQDSEYVVYKELYKGTNEKIYMRDVCTIEPQWLPFYAEKLCSITESSSTQYPPRYDDKSDQMICCRNVNYGPLNWALGLIDVPMHLAEPGIEMIKHFAAALLNGDVIDWFKKYKDKLLSPPSLLTKSWSKLQPRANKMLQAMTYANVKSRKNLSELWKNEANFLKKEYLLWLPESMHPEICQDWPPK